MFDDLWAFDIESQNWLEARRIPENITWPDVSIILDRKEKELLWFGISNLTICFCLEE